MKDARWDMHTTALRERFFRTLVGKEEVVAEHHLPIFINHEGCVDSRTGRGVDADVVCGIPAKSKEILALEVKSDNVVVGGMVAQKRHLGIGPIRVAGTKGGR